MGNRSVIALIISILLACCLILVCGLVAALLGYLYLDSSQASAQPTPQPSDIALQPTSTPVPIPSPTPMLVCPEAMQQVLLSAETSSDDSELGITGDSDSDVTKDDSITLVIYPVSGDKLGAPKYRIAPPELKQLQHDMAPQLSTWNIFTRLIPEDQRDMLSEYVIFTDGAASILAAVRQDYDDPEAWAIEIDAADVDDRNVLSFTLVHEFAHLLSLSSAQVTPDLELFEDPNDKTLLEKKRSACGTYFPGEGCSLPDSYINAFYSRFWPDIAEEWQVIDDLYDEDDLEDYFDKLYAFYEAHEDQFVTDYAATSPEEDLAESFSFFIFTLHPQEATIADEKVLFFYDYPELVDLRQQILIRFCEVAQ